MQERLKRVLVPINGTAADARAIAIVGQLLNGRPALVTLMYVVEVPQAIPLDAELPQEIEAGEAALERAEQLAKATPGIEPKHVTTDLLQARSAGTAIVDDAIERHAFAIVMATTNRVRHGRLTSGDTPGFVMRNAPCEVHLIRLAPGSGED